MNDRQQRPRVALMTIHQVPNYGSVLQSFATQTLLGQLGYDCDIINYTYPNAWHYSMGAKKGGGIIRSAKELVSALLHYTGIRRNLRLELKSFKKRHYNFTTKFADYRALCESDWSCYVAVIAGSDQIWNYRFVLGDKAFMLGFVPDKILKISLASSFANKSLTSEYIAKYQKYLSRFNAISVREQNGISILHDQLSIESSKLVLDPTLLINAKQWKSSISPTTKYRGRKFILLYGLYYAFNPKPYIFDLLSKLSKKYDCEIIALAGYASPANSGGLRMSDRTNASVNEFIELFDKAFMVVTSSFHGTAFAINFEKPLISIVPNTGDDRQSSLLRQLGMDSCITPIGMDIEKLSPFYDTVKSQERLLQIRKDNIDWLIKNLNSDITN